MDRHRTIDREESSFAPSGHIESALRQPVIGTTEFRESMLGTLRERANEMASRPPSEGFMNAVGVMLDRPFETHTVASLALAAGMSRSSFAQHFSERFRETPIDFLKQERLRCAASLLRTTPLSVQAIAERIGYASRSYFSRAFHEAFGIPPAAVRRNGASSAHAISRAAAE